MVMYALGYLWMPNPSKGLVETGLVTLATAPSGASVYLGKSRYTEKTPTLLRDLIPGQYSVTLALKNYKPWSRRITVRAGRATILEKILLFPKTFEKKTLANGPFSDLAAIGDSGALFLTHDKKSDDIFIFDTKKEKIKSFQAGNIFLEDGKVDAAHTVEKSSSALLELSAREVKEFIWFDSAKENSKPENISHFFIKSPERVMWSPRQPRILFSFHDGFLDRMDLSLGEVSAAFMREVMGFGLYDHKLYVLKSDGSFFRTDLNQKTPEALPLHPDLRKLLTQDRGLFPSFFGRRRFYELKALSEDEVLLWDEAGRLYGNRFPGPLLEKPAVGMSYFPDGKRLLVWQKDRIGILDFSAPGEPRLEWVFKQGRDIRQAFWVYDASYILFRDSEEVYLLETENLQNPGPEYLFKVQPRSSIDYAEESGRIFYLDATRGDLLSVELVPEGA